MSAKITDSSISIRIKFEFSYEFEHEFHESEMAIPTVSQDHGIIPAGREFRRSHVHPSVHSIISSEVWLSCSGPCPVGFCKPTRIKTTQTFWAATSGLSLGRKRFSL